MTGLHVRAALGARRWGPVPRQASMAAAGRVARVSAPSIRARLRRAIRAQVVIETVGRAGRAPAAGPRRSVRGQASIELLGLLPLVALIALVAMTVIASHTAGEQAGEAAEAGALVLLQGGSESPRAAAEHALGEAVSKRATITVSGRSVRVRVRPRLAVPIPGLADHLAGEAHADAGP
jgi:hypothetical protein